MRRIKSKLKAKGMSFREAVIDALRQTLLAEQAHAPFQLRDEAFSGKVGFAGQFAGDKLTAAIHADAEQRLCSTDRQGP